MCGTNMHIQKVWCGYWTIKNLARDTMNRVVFPACKRFPNPLLSLKVPLDQDTSNVNLSWDNSQTCEEDWRRRVAFASEKKQQFIRVPWFVRLTGPHGSDPGEKHRESIYIYTNSAAQGRGGRFTDGSTGVSGVFSFCVFLALSIPIYLCIKLPVYWSFKLSIFRAI